jgi:hypothetical protein
VSCGSIVPAAVGVGTLPCVLGAASIAAAAPVQAETPQQSIQSVVRSDGWLQVAETLADVDCCRLAAA